MNKLLGSSSLTSFKLAGITGFSPTQFNRMDRLKILRLSCFDFAAPSLDLEDTLDPLDGDENSAKTYLEELNISKLDDQDGLFMTYLNDPKSIVRFEELSSLTIDVRSLDDISITARLLDLAAFSIERLELSTENLYQHIGGSCFFFFLPLSVSVQFFFFLK